MSIYRCAADVLTEEFRVHVYHGPRVECWRAAERFSGLSLEEPDERCRGISWATLPEHNPLIWVSDQLPIVDAFATLAHEAAHALDRIAEHVCIRDAKGEFEAHGIAAVIRQAGPGIMRRILRAKAA